MKSMYPVHAALLAVGAAITLTLAGAAASVARSPDDPGGPPVITAVPSTVAFQGFLADAAGVPLDASVNLVFSLYAASSGGTALWTETHPSVPVADGVFAVALGGVTPFPSGLFDSPLRFLGIRVNGEAELPRTPLRASPFAFRSQRADTVDGDIRISNSGAVTLETDTSFQGSFFRANHPNGTRRAWFGVADHGSNRQDGLVVLDDAAGSPEVVIAASDSSGSLTLRDNLVSAITLDAGQDGDLSVRFPAGAVSSTEMLNEPGVASANNTGTVTLTSTTPQSVISRSLTAPSSGFILALGQSVARITHTLGTITSGAVGLSDDGVAFGTAQDMNVIISGNAPSGSYAIPAHVNGVFSVASGETKTIHIVASEATGDIDLEDLSLTLLFVPTSYGTVSPTLMAPGSVPGEGGILRGPQTRGDIEGGRAESERWNADRIEGELAAMRAQVAATSAQLAGLERQMGVRAR